MARPRKHGLDFFPLDVNFFHDIKVRRLLHHKGTAAVTVYQVILCEIYRQGYYLPWDDDLPFLISETSGAKAIEVREIITDCLQIGLLDQTLFEKRRILTSAEIEENYFSSDVVRWREYRKKKSCETPITQCETPITQCETPLPKRKTTKKEIPLSPSPYTLKEKNNKKKKPTTTTTVRVREGENRDGEDGTSKEQSFPMSVAQGVEELLNDSTWISHVEKLFKISSEGVKNWLQVFSTECSCRDNEAHENLTDIKRHFVDWLKKKDLSKASALSELNKQQWSKNTPAAPSRPKTEVERKWDALKKYLLDNVEESDQSLVIPLELVGFYPACNKLVIQASDNAMVDRLEQKYMKVLKTAISYEFGKPYVEYNIKPPGTPIQPP